MAAERLNGRAGQITLYTESFFVAPAGTMSLM